MDSGRENEKLGGVALRATGTDAIRGKQGEGGLGRREIKRTKSFARSSSLSMSHEKISLGQ